jgi:hypothetical protein
LFIPSSLRLGNSCVAGEATHSRSRGSAKRLWPDTSSIVCEFCVIVDFTWFYVYSVKPTWFLYRILFWNT